MKSNSDVTREPSSSNQGWYQAVRLCEFYLRKPTKTDILLERLPRGIGTRQRRLCQFLFIGVVRNLKLIDFAVKSFLEKKPRPRLKSILFVAAYEMLSGHASRIPRIIDHAVGQARYLTSPREAGLVNAVLRRIPEALSTPCKPGDDPVKQWALTRSHPEWMVQRWLHNYGANSTQKLLAWNQNSALVYLRLRKHSKDNIPSWLEPSQWPGFYLFDSRHRPDVEKLLYQGKAYVQDPSTRLAVELLAVRPGERILDLCAAPGGKSLLIADELESSEGLLVCIDRPGPRFHRLEENLQSAPKAKAVAVKADLRKTTPAMLAARNLPGSFDAVLLDAPCSNTGVLRRRPDAKWRLLPEDIERLTELQLQLLKRAAEFVCPAGRLVYSTCSLEPEENILVVEKFLEQTDEGFRLESKTVFTPWQDEHDGGAAFLLSKPKELLPKSG